jgi:hypothetical protein
MIRWGVRPGIVTSLELCARAQRSVGVGGEHNTWWIKHAWSPAVEVAATLVAMVIWGTAVVCVVIGGILRTRGIIHNPVGMHLLPHRIVRPQCIMVHPILVIRTLHSAMQSVTTLKSECNANPGVLWARHYAAGSLDESNVFVCVDFTWSLLGRRAAMGLLARCTLVMGAPVVRKLLVVPESKIAHLLMVSMSMLTVQRSAAVASAYWVGTRQEGNRLWFNLILLLLSAPACQKLLYQPRLDGAEGPCWGGGAC